MDKQIKAEIKGLMKQGFPEQLAIITACANAGKPEQAIEHLEELNEDQDEIKYGLELMGKRPFHEALAEVTAEEANIKITHHEIEPTNEMIYETALELKKILTVTLDVSGAVIENE
jgi:hypothetical protein